MGEYEKNLQEEVSKLSDNIEKRIEKVETEISKFVELAKGQSHFKDIDDIWGRTARGPKDGWGIILNLLVDMKKYKRE